nr:unnamed protein product [Digitaria exilis]
MCWVLKFTWLTEEDPVRQQSRSPRASTGGRVPERSADWTNQITGRGLREGRARPGACCEGSARARHGAVCGDRPRAHGGGRVRRAVGAAGWATQRKDGEREGNCDETQAGGRGGFAAPPARLLPRRLPFQRRNECTTEF